MVETILTPSEEPAAVLTPDTDVEPEVAEVAITEQAEPETPEPTAETPTEVPERVVPEADGYKLPDGVPPVMGEFANKQGFTQEQLDATLEHFGQYKTAEAQVAKDALRAQGGELIKTWGNDAKYNLSLAKRALKQNDPDGELAKTLNQTGFGNHPAVMNFLYKLGVDMQEGGFLESSVVRPKGKKTMAQRMFPDMPSTEA